MPPKKAKKEVPKELTINDMTTHTKDATPEETEKKKEIKAQKKVIREEEKKQEAIRHPKKALTAYTIFNTEYIKKLKSENQDKKLVDGFSKASEKWKTMDKEKRAPYVKKHMEEKQRVERQTQELKKKGFFTMTDGSKSTDEANDHLYKQKKKTKAARNSDSDSSSEEWVHPPPKRALSAWTLFVTAYSHVLRQSGHQQKDCFKLAGEKWQKMTPEEKAPYENQNKDLLAIQQTQKLELSKKGFYTLEDGSKSTDKKNAELLKMKNKPGKQDSDSEEEPQRLMIGKNKFEKTFGGLNINK